MKGNFNQFKKNVKKIIITTFVGAIMLNMGVVNSQAASKSWNLRYIKGAPGSEQISSWSSTVTTTSKTTTMSVSKVGGGAKIFVYTDNGIASLFSSSGKTSVSTKKNVKVYTYVKFSSTGNANSYPAGTLTY